MRVLSEVKDIKWRWMWSDEGKEIWRIPTKRHISLPAPLNVPRHFMFLTPYVYVRKKTKIQRRILMEMMSVIIYIGSEAYFVDKTFWSSILQRVQLTTWLGSEMGRHTWVASTFDDFQKLLFSCRHWAAMYLLFNLIKRCNLPGMSK